MTPDQPGDKLLDNDDYVGVEPDDEPMVDWRAPVTAEFSAAELWEAVFSEQDTDPIGFAPVGYPPATDPFDDDDPPATGDAWKRAPRRSRWT
jgi:hypothetical protein